MPISLLRRALCVGVLLALSGCAAAGLDRIAGRQDYDLAEGDEALGYRYEQVGPTTYAVSYAGPDGPSRSVRFTLPKAYAVEAKVFHRESVPSTFSLKAADGDLTIRVFVRAIERLPDDSIFRRHLAGAPYADEAMLETIAREENQEAEAGDYPGDVVLARNGRRFAQDGAVFHTALAALTNRVEITHNARMVRDGLYIRVAVDGSPQQDQSPIGEILSRIVATFEPKPTFENAG